MLSNITKIFTLLNLYQLKTLRYKNTKMCPVKRDTRLDREHYWIETLQTSVPYDLNETKKKTDPNLSVGFSLPYIPRSRERSHRCRNNVNFDKPKDMQSIFNYIHNYITDDIKSGFCHIRIHLNNIKRNIFKKIASEILLNGPFITSDLIKLQYYSFILTILMLNSISLKKQNWRKKYLNILAQLNLTKWAYKNFSHRNLRFFKLYWHDHIFNIN